MIHLLMGVAACAAIPAYSLIPSQYAKWKAAREVLRPREDKDIFLTFDDGPSQYTPEVLEVLRQNNVKAAFFIVSDYGEKMPQIVRRIKEEGHLVCIHSKSHQSLLYRGWGKSKSDLEASVATMRRLGLREKYYRPPWGQLNLFVLRYIRKMNLKLVLWDVMVGDWKADVTAKELEERLLEQTKPGSVICLHDGRGSEGAPRRTIEALRTAIPKLKEEGFVFRRLDEKYEKEHLN